MPNITLDGSVFKVKTLEISNQHWNSKAKSIVGQLHLRDLEAQIHCKGNQVLQASVADGRVVSDPVGDCLQRPVLNLDLLAPEVRPLRF